MQMTQAYEAEEMSCNQVVIDSAVYRLKITLPLYDLHTAAVKGSGWVGGATAHLSMM